MFVTSYSRGYRGEDYFQEFRVFVRIEFQVKKGFTIMKIFYTNPNSSNKIARQKLARKSYHFESTV